MQLPGYDWNECALLVQTERVLHESVSASKCIGELRPRRDRRAAASTQQNEEPYRYGEQAQ